MTVKYKTLAEIMLAEEQAEIDVNSLGHIIVWPLYRVRAELKRIGVETLTRDKAIEFVLWRNKEAGVSIAAELRSLSKQLEQEKRYSEALSERLK